MTLAALPVSQSSMEFISDNFEKHKVRENKMQMGRFATQAQTSRVRQIQPMFQWDYSQCPRFQTHPLPSGFSQYPGTHTALALGCSSQWPGNQTQRSLLNIQ